MTMTRCFGLLLATAAMAGSSVAAGCGGTAVGPRLVGPRGDGIGADGSAPVASDGQDVEMEAGESPWGDFGELCDETTDCESGYCVDGYEEEVCTVRCDSDCPSGWTCQQDVTVFPDVVFVCVPAFPRLCFPCDANADCRLAGEGNEHACVPAGDEGAFCGGSCDSRPCPDRWYCAVVSDVDGAQTKQCMPIPGSGQTASSALCTCSPGAVAAAASTTCRARGEAGVCEGQRVCTSAGLTDCDAEAPAPDECNGVDDDCNGLTDDGFEPEPCFAGGCEGQTICMGADGPTCSASEPAPEVCGGGDEDCDGVTDEDDADGCAPTWLDEDGDDYGAGDPRCLCAPSGSWQGSKPGDCDDAAQPVHPDAPEVCNGRDDDCDGEIDEDDAIGCSLFHADADQDGFGNQGDARCVCAPTGVYTSKSNTDCNDGDAAISPGESEVCDGGKDNDCDGLTDEPGAGNCTLYFSDGDDDGYGNANLFACLCAPMGDLVTSNGGDCDDEDAAVSPGATEVCDGLLDEDCDGLTDEEDAYGCTEWLRDADDDGYGLDGDTRCLCAPEAPYQAGAGGDCNDQVAAVRPDAPEVCNGGIDDDCDGLADGAGSAGCTTFYRDGDSDSYGGDGGDGDSACLCKPSTPWVAGNANDCDDGSPFAHPGATEVCNGVDDDCNGETDEGALGSCSAFYRDLDGDGWGQPGESQCLCGPSGEFTAAKTGDCDDDAAQVYPFAPELCDGGGVDEDCDGATDETGAQGCVTYYRDADDDGYGLLGDFLCLCAPSGEHRAEGSGDCDDADAAANPGAVETCDGVDDDCDGATDEPGAEGCTTYLKDSDLDGYGVAGDERCLCAPSTPYLATVGGDCNDADPGANPGEVEVCNGIDDDCNGAADDPGTQGCVEFFEDADGDGAGVAGSSQCLCAPNEVFRATGAGDCADDDPAVSPAAVERCNGGVDDDCDGETDEEAAFGCTLYLRDADGDGVGVTGDFLCLCGPDDTYRAETGGDCDDSAASAYPGAEEACNGGVDDDCDGLADEEGAAGCLPLLKDVDGDGYGVTGDARCLCGPTGAYAAAFGGDCDDASALVSPGAVEYCNATDDDCDGAVDEEGSVGCKEHFADLDGDGWGNDPRCLCAPEGDWTARKGPDCADDDPERNPGLEEQCAEGGPAIDDDCDGETDESGAVGCITYYQDGDADSYGVTATGTCECAAPAGYVAASGDCDDGDQTVNPGATEVCNAKDDDCDGAYDDGCGLASDPISWPTFKYGPRRTGHSKENWGPSSYAGVWTWDPPDGQYQAWENENSPIITADGNIVVQVREWVYKLRRTDGSLMWKHELALAPFNRAGPSVRDGGLIAAPSGNGLALLRPYIDPSCNCEKVEQLWDAQFPGTDMGFGIEGAPLDAHNMPMYNFVTCTPMFDPEGNAYVVTKTHAYRVGTTGEIDWSLAVPNSQYVPAHMAVGPPGTTGAGRLYFGNTNHAIYAIDPSGFVYWTHFDAGADIDASVAIDKLGRIFLPYGDQFVAVADMDTYAVEIDRYTNGAMYDTDTDPAIYDDGTTEHIFVSPNTSTLWNLRLTGSGPSFVLDWTDNSIAKGASLTATPVIDENGILYMGTDEGFGGPDFLALDIAAGPGHYPWTMNTNGNVNVDGAAAIGQGWLVFSDDRSRVYCVGCL